MKKRSIGILYGGKSGEHEVSCMSAASIVKNLAETRYTVLLIGIDKNGIWYHQENMPPAGIKSLPIEKHPDRIVSVIPGKGLYVRETVLEIDFIFPILHGSFGEDGKTQGLLEIADIPYAGAGVLGSSLGMDKGKTKQIWNDAGLPIIPFLYLKKSDFYSPAFSFENLSAEINRVFSLPLFIKPSSTGSSIGVTKIETIDMLSDALTKAFNFDTKVLIEPAVKAKEIECSVMGNGTPTAFTPGQIVPTHSFYSYQAKYIDPNGAKLIIPAEITNEQTEEIKRIAVLAYKSANIEGMARVDFFIEHSTGNILLNEINTIPGFTEISMFPRMCEASGLSYSKLLDNLIDLGYERYKENRSINFNITSDYKK